MQNHQVRLIGQNDLPAGIHWAMVEVDGCMTAYLTPAALTEEGLAEAWAAYRRLVAPSPPQPRPLGPVTDEWVNPFQVAAV
jgi:hypothetical protein